MSISGLGSISGASSHTSVSSSSQPEVEDNSVQSGHLFVEMLTSHPIYRTFIRVICDYEVRLVHGVPYLHWYVLVRMKDSKSPYLTFEVTTMDMTDLIPTTRNVVPNGGFLAKLLFSPTDVGTYRGSLYQLCQLADETVIEMNRYHFVESNCQHFCNRLLKKMGFKTFSTTVGPEMGGDDQGFDVLTVITRNIYDAAIGDEPTAAQTAVISGAVGAPSPLKGDLHVAYGILLPLADKWCDIGFKLLFDYDTLDRISEKYRKPRRCLSEMLTLWFKKRPVKPWKTLGDAVEQYDSSIAAQLCGRETMQTSPV